MANLFDNILIPIDFSNNTEASIKQAIELLYEGSSKIHLLHVTKPRTSHSIIHGRATKEEKHKSLQETMNKLQQWKYAIEETVPDCVVKNYLVEGGIEDEIISAAIQIQPQIIIIGKKSKYSSLRFTRMMSPHALAKITDCPILTVGKNAVNTRIKVIVVPVGSFIPRRKIALLETFAKKFRARIHLVALQNKLFATESERNTILETYNILKSRTNIQLEYHLLNSTNLAKAALKYAQEIGADIMFVNPGKETKISVLTGRHIEEALTSFSKLKLLFVEPFHDK